MYSLYDYQDKGVGSIRHAYIEGFRAPLFCLPTGGGKTICFSYIAHSTAMRGKKVLILVHRAELMKQTAASLLGGGVIHGLISPNHRLNLMAPVQVASVQTLVNRMHNLPFIPDLIIIDEAHHATAGTWRKICNHYSKALLLGVTATPIRSDGAGLGVSAGGFFDCLIMGPQIGDLIARKFLVRPIVYAPLQGLNLDTVKVDAKRADFNKSELITVIDKPKITGDAVNEYKRLCPGAPTVVFCVSIEHAEHVAAQFRAAGFKFYVVDGNTEEKQRERILAGLGNGSVQGVCSCELISEGTDLPAVGCVIMLRPTKSQGLYIQMVGRGLRKAEGKTVCYILDHAGNVLRHGMPDDARQWSLEGEKKQKKRKGYVKAGPRLKQCPSCFLMHSPGPVCPGCNRIYNNGISDVSTVRGELEEVTPAHALEIKRMLINEVSAARTLDELEAIAAKRGYKKEWASYVMEKRGEK